MTPVMQRVLHDPANGAYGDCHRAALASILDLAIDDVPHVMDGLGPDEGEIFNQRQEAFLKTRGLVPIIFPIGPDLTLEMTLLACQAWNPGTYFLLGGESASGFGHTVVAGGGQIVHDPHPDQVGIIGPMNDGFFWVTYIGVGPK